MAPPVPGPYASSSYQPPPPVPPNPYAQPSFQTLPFRPNPSAPSTFPIHSNPSAPPLYRPIPIRPNPPASPPFPPIPDCIRNPNNYPIRDIEAALRQMEMVMQQHGARFDVNRHYDPESTAYRVAYESAASHVDTRNAMAEQRVVYKYPGRLVWNIHSFYPTTWHGGCR